MSSSLPITSNQISSFCLSSPTNKWACHKLESDAVGTWARASHAMYSTTTNHHQLFKSSTTVISDTKVVAITERRLPKTFASILSRPFNFKYFQRAARQSLKRKVACYGKSTICIHIYIVFAGAPTAPLLHPKGKHLNKHTFAFMNLTQ